MNPKASSDEKSTTAGVIAPPPLLALIALIAGIIASKTIPLGWLDSVPSAPRYTLGGILVLFALYLELMASSRFSKAGTPKAPWKPTKALATGGIFAILRNPMYVGFVLFELGIAIVGGFSWLIVAAFILAIVLHFGVVLREEKYLTSLFGAPYKDYCAQVRRYGLF